MALNLIYNQNQFVSELDLLLDFQNAVLQAGPGLHSFDTEAKYTALRSALLAEPKYAVLLPGFVQRNETLGKMWEETREFSADLDQRSLEVRRQFEPIIAEADRIDLFGPKAIAPVDNGYYDPSSWTGASHPAARLIAVKTLLPVASAAIEQLIVSLGVGGHNGGPLLDTTGEAIEALRSLHAALGRILQAADEGKLEDAYHDGMVIEAARFAKRAARQLRDDPMPFAMSALLLGILSACGFPGLGGFVSAAALNVKKK